ncbi:hypothetical protein D1832_10370 [Dermacoccus abyssi]|uniref:Uncharacterized protein n=1 Tax=Dermacoccus abyssi TaxID=322596 RepID=A0A417Z3F0_9MICO|nr:hypothetical protein D1832_10370 [Dermacoccus abyssi]
MGVLGAFIVMVATAMQSQLDVAEIWAWQRVSKKIAPEMVDQAIPKGTMFFPREGYKKPDRLAWIPEDVKVKFEERSKRSAAWMVLLLGATLVFVSEVESALPQWGVFVGPVCLVAALWVGDLFTKSISRPAEERCTEAIKVKIPIYYAQRKEEMESKKFAARIKRGAVRILRPVTSAFSLFRRFVREGSAK